MQRFMNVVLRDVEEQYTVRVRVKREVGTEAVTSAGEGVSARTTPVPGELAIMQGTSKANPSSRMSGGPSAELHPRDGNNEQDHCPLPEPWPNDVQNATSRPHQGGGIREAPPPPPAVKVRELLHPTSCGL